MNIHKTFPLFIRLLLTAYDITANNLQEMNVYIAQFLKKLTFFTKIYYY